MTLLLTGIIFFPITSLVFKDFDDNGWIFSKILGLGTAGVILWNFSHLKLLKFTQLNCYLMIAIIAIINLILLIKKREKIKGQKVNWNHIAIIELIFLSLFIIWAYVRSFVPEINSSTEHFMNYGFINRLMHTDYLPAEDIWLSGHSINYYYFGQYIAAFLSKMATTDVAETYNLMLAVIAAFLFTLPYSIGMTLGNHLTKNNIRKFAKVVPVAIGILAGLSVSLGGTTHYTIYKFFLNETDYSYTNPCYYIGYKPDTNDKTITAFPSYMNIEGDLHAHHIDTIFTITTLALLLQFLLDYKQDENKWKSVFNFRIFFIGILLGIQKMTNYWDFPIYLVIIGAVFVVKNFIQYKDFKQKFLITILQLLEVIFLQELVSFLFSKNLYISATQVYLTHITSPLYKLLVLWGLPVLCVIIHIGTTLYKYFKEKKGSIFEYIKKMNFTDIFTIILGVCAIGLIILPEIIYLKDIYGDEYKRANTMFKLVFNAITIFHICTSYILIKLLYEKFSKFVKISVTAILLIFITTFGYGLNAIKYATNNLKKQTSDLKDTESYIRQVAPDDYEAIQWIKQNIPRDSVILEKTSGSFELSSIVSVFTANPTLLGWYGHEWVWRAKPDYTAPDELVERWSDIFTIYSSDDRNQVISLIEKYDISYIYVGNIEFDGLNSINLDLLFSLGEVVYQDDTDYTKSPVYIIKVK